MSANLLEIYESVGGYAKAGAEQAAAASARIAEVVRDGGLLLAEGVVYHVNHSTQALGAVVKSRSPEELAAAQRAWLEGAINRAADDFKTGLDLTGRLLTETAPAAVSAAVVSAPVAVEAAAPVAAVEVAPAPVVEEAPVVEAAPVAEAAPAVEEVPAAEEAPIVAEAAPVTEEIAAESAALPTETAAEASAAPVAEASAASKARGPRRGRAAKAEGAVVAAE